MTDKVGDLRSAGITGEHFIFSTESGREISDCIEAARAGRLPDGIKLRRMGRRDAAQPVSTGGAPEPAQRTSRRTENVAKPGKMKNEPKRNRLKRRK